MLGLGGVGLSLLAALLWEGRSVAPAVQRPATGSSEASHPLALAPAQAPVPRTRATDALADPQARTSARARGEDDALDHVHPITPEHEALRAELQLVAALNDALDLGDASGMRALIARYDAIAPEDPLRLAEGYERLADCLEARDPAGRANARANAQHYYDDARGSSLRRYVRRLCLETSADTRP